ncbi:NUDIX domain-containing protein [Eisenbergiella sp.]
MDAETNPGIRLRNMTSLYISRGTKMLLLYRIGSRVVPPSWCGIGGHFEPDELNDPRKCVLRELKEETGITEADLENMFLRYVTMKLKDGEIRQNYYYFAELKNQIFSEALPECNEGILEWTAYESLAQRRMPYTAGYVIRHYLETGRHTGALYCGTAVPGGISWAELTDF